MGASPAPLLPPEVGVISEKKVFLSVSRERKVVETRDQDWRVQKGRIMFDGAWFGVSRRFGSGDMEVSSLLQKAKIWLSVEGKKCSPESC